MQRDDDSFLKLRCAATDCVGGIAMAIGEPFHQNYLQHFLRLALHGMELDFFDLREATYNFFSKLAISLQEKFAPLLETVLPMLIATCLSQDGVMMSGREELGGNDPDWVHDNKSDDSDHVEDANDDDDDDSDDGGKINFSIRSGALDEKIAALICLSNIVENTGQHFFPYFEKVFPGLDELSEYPHPTLRAHSTIVLHEIMRSMNNLYPHSPLPGQAVVRPEVQNIVNQVVPLLIVRLVEEDEKEVCADAAEALADSLNMYGIGILGDKVDFVYKGCLAIMEQKAPCQQDEEDRDEKEVADHDEVLMDHVTDLIAAMSKAIGPPFSKNYKKLHTALLKFTGPTHPQYDRSMSIGCFAEVVEHLGNELSHFIPSLVQTMFAGLQDSSVAVRRNSAFLAGNLVSYGGSAIAQHYARILQHLTPLLSIGQVSDDENPLVACRDNACSAVAKMLMVAAQAPNFPLTETVTLYLSALPLRSDMAECKYVYACLLGLCNGQPQVMNQFLPQVVSIISQVLGTNPDWVTKELQANLLGMVRKIATSLGDNFVSLVSTLPEPQQKNLMTFLSS